MKQFNVRYLIKRQNKQYEEAYKQFDSMQECYEFINGLKEQILPSTIKGWTNVSCYITDTYTMKGDYRTYYLMDGKEM